MSMPNESEQTNYGRQRLASVLRAAFAVFVVAPVLAAVVAVPALVRAAETVDAPGTVVLNAADPAPTGPFSIATGEYKLPARIDPDILPKTATELWARVFWPKDLSQPRPIVFLLHGNHSTCGEGSNPRNDSDCSYTTKGYCMRGQTVVPSHEGFNYFASHLATYGYIVVSINSNRGISCGDSLDDDFGLILARGRLVLKHIETWHRWATKGDAPAGLGVAANAFVGAVDLGHVGLLGHSRGGEGMRAAYNLYRDSDSPWRARIPGLDIRGIFEIGSVDGQTSRTLDADNTAWNQLLPMCDGDIEDLEGRMPFERMILKTHEQRPSPKSLYMVWGANHNFFNSEWQASDSQECYGHRPIFGSGYTSKAQQKIATAAVTSFFLGNVGSQTRGEFGLHFDPQAHLPQWLTGLTRIDRDYVGTFDQAFDQRIDDFSERTGTSSNHVLNSASLVTVNNQTGEIPSRAAIRWKDSGADHFVQLNWTKRGEGRSVNGLGWLDFRVARMAAYKGIKEPTNFGIALVDQNDRLTSEVPVQGYQTILGPANVVTLFQTVRIPLRAFNLRPDMKVRGVRLIFDSSKRGAIYLANVRFSSSIIDQKLVPESELATAPPAETDSASASGLAATFPPRIREYPAEFVGTRLRFDVNAIDFEFRTADGFPVSDEIPTLRLGDRIFKVSRFGKDGSTRTLIFKVPFEALGKLPAHGPMSVQYGSGRRVRLWRLPDFHKSDLMIQ